MADQTCFIERLVAILHSRNITISQFCQDTGIYRARFFYQKGNKHRKVYYMAIAYYLNMTVENLVDGTDAMDDWYC